VNALLERARVVVDRIDKLLALLETTGDDDMLSESTEDALGDLSAARWPLKRAIEKAAGGET